jgi:hypothetical protein
VNGPRSRTPRSRGPFVDWLPVNGRVRASDLLLCTRVKRPPEPCAGSNPAGAQKPEQRDHPALRRKCQTSRAGPSPAGSGSLSLRLADRECVASGSTGGGETSSAPLTGHRARAGLRGTAATPEGRPARTRAPLTPGPRPAAGSIPEDEPPRSPRRGASPGHDVPGRPATRERAEGAARPYTGPRRSCPVDDRPSRSPRQSPRGPRKSTEVTRA